MWDWSYYKQIRIIHSMNDLLCKNFMTTASAKKHRKIVASL